MYTRNDDDVTDCESRRAGFRARKVTSRDWSHDYIDLR